MIWLVTPQVKGVRNVPNGFASGGLVLGVPYGLFLLMFRKSNEYFIDEFLKQEDEQEKQTTQTSDMR